MAKALIPGSFDPITNGHLDIIKRTAEIFDEVVVLVSKNSSKNYMLCSNSRAALIADAVKELKNVSVDTFDGLLVSYVNSKKIDVIVKGLRNTEDYAYENNMALSNMRLSQSIYSHKIETLYMPCKPEYTDISSSLVRLMIKENCDISSLVPNAELLNSLLQ